MPISSIADLIRTHGAERGGQPALTADGHTVTFAQLDARSNQVAQALAGEGVGAGDRVAYLDANAAQYYELLFGGAKLGAVSVAVSWRLAPVEIAAIIADAQARVLVVGAAFAATVEAVEAELPGVKKIIVVGGSTRHEGDDEVRHQVDHQDYDEWVDAAPAIDPGLCAKPDDVRIQLYTSGTTGLPKGVMLTEHNLLSLLRMAGETLDLGPDSVNLVAMPLFHISGSGYSLSGFHAGCHTVLLREAHPDTILRSVVEHGVTNLFAVPAVLRTMLGVAGIAELDLSSLRTIAYGASPISLAVLVRAIETFRCDFVQVYGLSETAGTVTMLTPEDHRRALETAGTGAGGTAEVAGALGALGADKAVGADREVATAGAAGRLRSAGRAVPGARVRIVPPHTGADAEPGEVGEIWIHSPQNTPGYWHNPRETAALLEDGWVRTGDAGYLDEDGYLFIHDRVKDMIITGAENVYPAEVENVLMSHPDIADVAVIGVPSERWGETVKAVVVAEAGRTPTTEDVVSFARARLAAYKCPTSIDLVDALPRNAAGKVLKRELRDPYWSGRLRSVS
ncbi:MULTISPECIES: long-chain-fatty-acid--CoA ligase [Frankia]|uniref:Long-chain-fatty-acid CoA ligase n=1 Tax=Frankia alni (strain DSM 45986 / CECT 9034 / ACN14a) TaxID=326424 RepID=Q0RL74_FRAAA|nr:MULTISPECIES: long-chain-fatty-acid--CoA ligase [Frankia]CAJ61731.1 putative long-chain-fatty-acid CoA ligase [Frankia alni ACN14a]